MRATATLSEHLEELVQVKANVEVEITQPADQVGPESEATLRVVTCEDAAEDIDLDLVPEFAELTTVHL